MNRFLKEKEQAAADKVKEESQAVAGGRCWKRVLLRSFQNTGDLDTCLSLKIKLPSSVLFRDLGPAHHHPSCHCGLLRRCHLLLQDGWLNAVFFYLCLAISSLNVKNL